MKSETTVRIELGLDDIKRGLITEARKHVPKAMDVQSVTFTISEVGADPMDRFPGNKELTGATVTFAPRAPNPQR